MGVLSCNRRNCSNIMCDRYNTTFGYVCDDCFSEMCIAQKSDEDFTIESFMRSDKFAVDDLKVDLSEVFKL